MPRRLFGLLVLPLVWGATRTPGAADPIPPPARACQPCHQQIVASFLRTAHSRTSAEATGQTIKGRFSEGRNVLRTRSKSVYFKMERRAGVFYQTGVDSSHDATITRRMDLVIGSGRRGQSYLYWQNGLLFELPVSYLTGIDQWINSPGYRDGQIDFGRLIVPRCLECHTTSVPLETGGGVARYSRPYVLGISCAKCHGDGRKHVQYQSAHLTETRGRYILNPAHFTRDRKVDNCALCHSGDRNPKEPPFSYRPGERLDDYLVPPSHQGVPIPDVHGDQIGLLRRSKCFRSSPEMSCSTCHDVHRPEHDLARFAEKCLLCHQITEHPNAEEIGGRMMASCIDCHMPNRKSNAIEINTPGKRFALYFRSHAIGIYPEAAAAVLQSSAEQQNR